MKGIDGVETNVNPAGHSFRAIDTAHLKRSGARTPCVRFVPVNFTLFILLRAACCAAVKNNRYGCIRLQQAQQRNDRF
jgi:hypothetical protein